MKSISLRSLISVFVFLCSSGLRADEGKEIGFVERFALGQDRGAALEELIPGTDQYYYYHCLFLEQQKKWDEQIAVVRQWEKRESSHQMRKEIYYRRALLRYNDDQQGTLEFIRRELGLNFNHQRDNLNQKPNLPTTLDQNHISRAQYLSQALRNNNNLGNLRETGLDFVARNNVELNKEQKRDLLRKLQWPDYPGLVDRIVEDLALKESTGFGEFTIHSKLTEAQLIEFAQKRPEVMRNENYIAERLIRMRPSDDVNWQFDPETKEAYLAEIWEFVTGLEPSLNSLKAHVLYHLLQTRRERGNYDRDLFLAYLMLPRSIGYVEPAYLQRQEFRGRAANLGSDYSRMTALPPVSNDQDLAWDYLATFILADEGPDAFRKYIREKPLEHLWAETTVWKTSLRNWRRFRAVCPLPGSREPRGKRRRAATG
ncbi:MAG: hypothetical protein ACI8UO_006669 [Verrucomicrobiales bacterium]|jgi:hypothetical protein